MRTTTQPKTTRFTSSIHQGRIRRCAALLAVLAAGGMAAERTAVSVTFGTDAKEDGITTRIWSRPGGETIATYGGKTGLQTDLVNGAWGLWGDVSDDFLHGGTHRVAFTVEYWDKAVDGEQGFKLLYDSAQRPLSRAPVTFFTGSNTWKTATYLIENAGFAGRQEQGADFKLFCTDTGFCIRRIAIEKIPEAVPTIRVSVVPTATGLLTGQRTNLCAIYAPSYATDAFATWSSSDPAVATVDARGQVVGVAAGTAVITAAVRDGGPASACTVTVRAVPRTGAIAARAGAFLDSIGVNAAINNRGETLARTIECVKHLGVRWIRSGLGLQAQDYVDLHKATGVRYSLGFGGDLNRFLMGARRIAEGKMLLAFEGPNEPNNWGLTYQDVKGGGGDSWVPVARLQRDFYNAVKADPVLRSYPVWHLSEGGAETDNVGMQLLAIPKGAGIAMPDGTRYADYATVHNYCSHPSWQGLHDNQAWLSSDPTSKCPVDGLYVEYGRTWARKFAGYSEADLLTLPRVTTETGITLDGIITEEIQARLYLDVYLAQFAQGWTWTAMYILRDRVDEGGNQTFGFYKPDYTPRKAATYLHNLTTILADPGAIALPGRLDYSIPDRPAAVHDLLLQKSDGRFCLVVWGERYATAGSDTVTVKLGRRFAKATLYDPTVGTEPTATLTDVDAVPVTVGTNPVIIEL